MRTWLHSVGVGVALVLLMAPVAQKALLVVPEEKLAGVEVAMPQPLFSLTTWLDGSFQNAASAWFDRWYGLRGYLVRTDNQLNFSVFHQITARHRHGLVLGLENVLFERSYIDNYMNLDAASDSFIDRNARRMAVLQERLARHGIPFLFLVTPSKAMLRPEWVPPWYKSHRRKVRSNYERYLEATQRHGVRTFDAVAFCQRLLQEESIPGFSRSGTHWNHWLALRATQALRDEFAALLGHRLPTATITDVKMGLPPRHPDADLAKLANLWSMASFTHPNPYPEVRVEVPPGAVRPNVLFVGGSFVQQLVRNLVDYALAAPETENYFYFEQKVLTDVQRELLERDIVVIELNQDAMNGAAGRGFLDEALAKMPAAGTGAQALEGRP